MVPRNLKSPPLTLPGPRAGLFRRLTDGSVPFMKHSLEFAGRAQPTSPFRGATRNRIILVGARRDARKLLRQLDKGPGRSMTFVGFIDAGHLHASRPRSRGRHLAIHPRMDPVPILGGLDSLDELVEPRRPLMWLSRYPIGPGATFVLVLPSLPTLRLLCTGSRSMSNASILIHFASIRPANQRGLIPIWVWPSPLRFLRTIVRIDRARTAKPVADVVIATLRLSHAWPLCSRWFSLPSC